MHNPFQLTPRNVEDSFFIGVVKDNNDPLKMRRLRLSCVPLYGNIPTENLPWAAPLIYDGFGGSATSSAVSIPIVGSKLYFKLAGGDPVFPYYMGYVTDSTTVPSMFKTNYPNRYGFSDETGNFLVVDKTAGTVEFHHKSGTDIQITSTGAVNVITKDTVQVNVTGDTDLTVSGSVNATAGAQINWTAPIIKLTGSVDIIGPMTQDSGIGGGAAVFAQDVKVNNTMSVVSHYHTSVDSNGDTATTSPMID